MGAFRAWVGEWGQVRGKRGRLAWGAFAALKSLKVTFRALASFLVTVGGGGGRFSGLWSVKVAFGESDAVNSAFAAGGLLGLMP
ncbi:hypothetical protein GCM10009754_45430 [Amycolatopsis minnesotensis]|uniref:Uncharacterized protein n=2 Tax=Amycolatopsis minnesotensis TaxID=337894 RepID=A0ABP5CR72_9PSEU